MYISFLLFIIITCVVFYFGMKVGSKYFYNVRYHIELLWRQNLKLASLIGKKRQSDNPELATYLEEIYNPAMDKNGELIDILLLHYFDLQNEEDREYIRQHKHSKVFPPIIKKNK